ncbi:MAG: hypothetical protein ACN6OB_15915 [Chryseobacterium jejuense]|uniref:hypothetical protein n=1 Tax=Chryseobacterium jejuense TaxID=445960 RepID=UPI003D0E8C9A
MKKILSIGITLFCLTACQKDDVADSSAPFEMRAASAEYITASALPVTKVNNHITSNTTWSGVIEIDGTIAVKNGATLTILPATFIKAKPNAIQEGPGLLVITKTGKINAVGTENQPIVFTSYRLLDGDENTIPRGGDFAGVMILGDARTNVPSTTTIDGLFGPDYYYGGTNNNHNGGIMKYVRIEFGGADIMPSILYEISSLVLAGVGEGTTLDHIQVSHAQDDSFEFYGGNVNASNLVSFAPEDDHFDCILGYTGTITCALGLADYNSPHRLSGSVYDSQGIEVENNIHGTATVLMTHPTFNNLSIIGVWMEPFSRMYGNGIYIRRNGKLTLNNALITGYPTGIKVEGTGSELSTNSDYNSIRTHAFKLAAIGAGTAGIPASNLLVADTSPTWGMTQPFFNEGFWNIAPRDCGNFRGNWTKYNFSILE